MSVEKEQTPRFLDFDGEDKSLSIDEDEPSREKGSAVVGFAPVNAKQVELNRRVSKPLKINSRQSRTSSATITQHSRGSSTGANTSNHGSEDEEEEDVKEDAQLSESPKSVVFADTASPDEVRRRKHETHKKKRSKHKRSGSLLKQTSVELHKNVNHPKIVKKEHRRKKSIDEILQGRTDLMIKVSRSGKYQSRFFQLSKDGSELRWSSKPLSEKESKLSFPSSSSKKRMLLANVTELIVGPQTKRFREYDWKKHAPWLCFSIITNERTIDIQCTTQQQFMKWFLGIQELIPLNARYISKAKLLWMQAIIKTIQIALNNGKMSVYGVWDALVKQARVDLADEIDDDLEDEPAAANNSAPRSSGASSTARKGLHVRSSSSASNSSNSSASLRIPSPGLNSSPNADSVSPATRFEASAYMGSPIQASTSKSFF